MRDVAHALAYLGLIGWLAVPLVPIAALEWRAARRERHRAAMHLRIARNVTEQLREALVDAERLAAQKLAERLHDADAAADDPEHD